jgi:hypothetical protein
MYTMVKAAFLVALVGANASATTILYTTEVVGTTGGGEVLYRVTYDLTDVQFLLNQELDLRFSPSVFNSILNPVAPVGLFDVLLLQPNNPPGAFGDYSLMALVDNPSVAGPFSVEFTLVNGQSFPETQPFFFNQLDSNGAVIALLESGSALGVPTSDDPIPEPRTIMMAFTGIIGVWILGKRTQRPL